MPVDEAAMRRELPKLRRSLTLAKNSKDPMKVLDAVKKAFEKFDEYGYPDEWGVWQRAKSDAEFDLLRNPR